MKSITRWACALLVLLAIPSCAQDTATISAEDAGRKVSTRAYEAIVANDGSVSSLKINGQEFLRMRGPSRGAYFYQNGNIDLNQITAEGTSTLVAKGDKASARYEFKPDSMTWSLTNSTDKYMNFFMVLDPGVGIGRGENGEWKKSPVGQDWKKSTWFGEKSKLEISGATRAWGPWNDLNQVWEAMLAPNETRVVEFKIGVPDAAETAKIKELSGAASTSVSTSASTPEPARTGLSLPSFFGDNMVLQREMPNPIWGWADAGEAVTVSVGKQSQSTHADEKGKWIIKLDPLPVGGPYQITVKGKSTMTLKNVLSGDVWICSGQSNMALTLHESIDGASEVDSINDPQLRWFKADLKASATLQDNVGGNWNLA
jgi:hypothetical protein